MKERYPAMHARALPSSPVSQPHLQRKHAVLLVAGVLVLHLWLLAVRVRVRWGRRDRV